MLRDWSVGDWCFGYTSESIPGSETGRRGRNPKPRKRVIILEVAPAGCELIFRWFVDVGRSLDWIARELTRQNAPKDRRSRSRGWHHAYVKHVLRNEKYIGIWRWGQTTTNANPLTGQLVIENRSPEEAAKWVSVRPELRIVEDEQFFRAQARLDELEAKWLAFRKINGTLKGSTSSLSQPRHLLQQLIKCGACGSTFQVSGSKGRYLVCSGYLKGLCQCKTRLSRPLAEAKIVQVISERVLNQPAWLNAVVRERPTGLGARGQKDSPNELADVEKEIEISQQVQRRLADAIENGNDDITELTTRLRQRQTGLRRATTATSPLAVGEHRCSRTSDASVDRRRASSASQGSARK